MMKQFKYIITGNPDSISNKHRMKFNNRPLLYRMKIKLSVNILFWKMDIKYKINKLIKRIKS